MFRKLALISTAATFATFTGVSAATPLNLNFGVTVDDDNTNTPGQVHGGITGTNWSLVTGDTTIAADADGEPVSLDVTLGRETSHGSNVIDWSQTSGYTHNALGGTLSDTVFDGTNAQSATYVGNNQGSLGMRLSGLDAGEYEIYATGRNTNVTSDAQPFYFATVLSWWGNFDYSSITPVQVSNSGSGNEIWDEEQNYARATITLAENEDLIVISGADRGFLNTVQVVPEPGSLALLLGGATLLIRRRTGVA